MVPFVRVIFHWTSETEYPPLNPCNRLYNKSLVRHDTKISGREEAPDEKNSTHVKWMVSGRSHVNMVSGRSHVNMVSGASPSNVPLSATENTKTI